MRSDEKLIPFQVLIGKREQVLRAVASQHYLPSDGVDAFKLIVGKCLVLGLRRMRYLARDDDLEAENFVQPFVRLVGIAGAIIVAVDPDEIVFESGESRGRLAERLDRDNPIVSRRFPVRLKVSDDCGLSGEENFGERH